MRNKTDSIEIICLNSPPKTKMEESINVIRLLPILINPLSESELNESLKYGEASTFNVQ